MIFSRKSPFTGKVNAMDLPVTIEQVQKWENGELIQNAMPNLSADEREFLISGYTADDWSKMFGDE